MSAINCRVAEIAQPKLSTVIGAKAQSTSNKKSFGFSASDKVEAPRSDAEIWNSIGVKVDTSDGIDDAELMELAQLASTQPAEFIRRLREDSANGTPVVYERTIPADYGVVIVKVRIENGELQSSVELQLDDLRDDMAKYFTEPMANEKAPAIVLSTSGKLEENGNLSAIKLAAELKNIPPFDVAKLSGEKETLEELEEANTIEGSGPRMEELRSIHRSIYSSLERVLAKVFAGFVDEGEVVNLTIKPEDYDVEIKAKLGDEKFDISADRLIPEAVVNLRAQANGHTEEYGEVIVVDKVKVDIAQSLGVLVPEKGDLEDAVITADGKLVPSEEAEMLGYLVMMALGLLTGDGMF